MDRKKTILIAAFVNASLLLVLFVVALTSQDEIISSVALEKKAEERLVEVVKASEPNLVPKVEVEIPPVKEVAIAPPPVIHKLPPVQVEKETPVVQVKKEPKHQEVVVKKGDSLDKIARMYQTTVDEVIQLNQLPGSFLKIGQVLLIPEGKKAAPSQKKPVLEKERIDGPEYYTMKVGDNPWGIAMKHHLKLDELLRINNLNEEKARKLKPGDRLRIR